VTVVRSIVIVSPMRID